VDLVGQLVLLELLAQGDRLVRQDPLDLVDLLTGRLVDRLMMSQREKPYPWIGLRNLNRMNPTVLKSKMLMWRCFKRHLRSHQTTRLEELYI
jgi:hypothetical protein